MTDRKNNRGHLNMPSDFVEKDVEVGIEIYDSLKKELGKEYKFVKKDNFLDIGFGFGGVSFAFAKDFKKILGIEISDYEIEIADLIKKELKYKNVDFIKSGVEKMPFDTKSMDFIFSNNTFEHIYNLDKGLKETSRILKKDGLFYLNVPNFFWVYEGHYQKFMLPYMPKFLFKFYLKLRGIDTKFLDTLNFLNPFSLKKSLKKNGFKIRKDISLKILKEIFYYGNYKYVHKAHKNKLKKIKIIRSLGLGPLVYLFFKITMLYPHMIYLLEKK